MSGTTHHLIFFGRTPELSWAELSRLNPTSQRIHQYAALLTGEEENSIRLFHMLGGAVRIATCLAQYDTISAHFVTDEICKNPSLPFSVSVLGQPEQSIRLSSLVKNEATARSVSTRYILPKPGELFLSSTISDKEKVQEFIFIPKGPHVLFAKIIGFQSYEQWNSRDYGRPFADPKHGMLPPKVARMAVNIAIQETRPVTVLDPFCGMGTIVAEAELLGAQAIGSDISESAVHATRSNLTWLASKYSHSAVSKPRLLIADAAHVSDMIESHSIDAIVTEPFLGSPMLGEGKVDPKKADNIVKGLEKLYIGCLKEWQTILKPGGVVMIALPSFTIGGRLRTVKKAIDMCENLGYTKLLGPIEYGRPHAVVKRAFYLFKKS